MKQLFATAVLVLMTLAAPLAAQKSPVVVELFTSQGCSSCPPADALLHDLAAREDVIALALHVDYWDYIGWKDPFGDPAHAARQRAYAQAGDRRMVYTPQMIINGVTDIVGSKPMDVADAIAAHAARPSEVDIDLARDGDTLTIRARSLTGTGGPMRVHLMRYDAEQTTEILRGENRGKTLSYANVVEGWTVLGDWDGASPLQMTTQMTGDKPCVVLIQRAGAGPILAAARIR